MEQHHSQPPPLNDSALQAMFQQQAYTVQQPEFITPGVAPMYSQQHEQGQHEQDQHEFDKLCETLTSSNTAVVSVFREAVVSQRNALDYTERNTERILNTFVRENQETRAMFKELFMGMLSRTQLPAAALYPALPAPPVTKDAEAKVADASPESASPRLTRCASPPATTGPKLAAPPCVMDCEEETDTPRTPTGEICEEDIAMAEQLYHESRKRKQTEPTIQEVKPKPKPATKCHKQVATSAKPVASVKSSPKAPSSPKASPKPKPAAKKRKTVDPGDYSRLHLRERCQMAKVELDKLDQDQQNLLRFLWSKGMDTRNGVVFSWPVSTRDAVTFHHLNNMANFIVMDLAGAAVVASSAPNSLTWLAKYLHLGDKERAAAVEKLVHSLLGFCELTLNYCQDSVRPREELPFCRQVTDVVGKVYPDVLVIPVELYMVVGVFLNVNGTKIVADESLREVHDKIYASEAHAHVLDAEMRHLFVPWGGSADMDVIHTARMQQFQYLTKFRKNGGLNKLRQVCVKVESSWIWRCWNPKPQPATHMLVPRIMDDHEVADAQESEEEGECSEEDNGDSDGDFDYNDDDE